VIAPERVDCNPETPGDAEVTALLGASERSDEAPRREPTIVTTPGTRLGRYLVIEEIGRGGMGVVLRAYDPNLEREVALKVVRAGALDAAAQARLVREARAMAKLSHPNVVAVYDVEHEDRVGGVVMAMEYVRGSTLRQWLEAEARSSREIIEAFVAAGRGLAAAHAEGLLHRDFKLDNVLVGDDRRVRVTDFGLARATGSRASSEPALGSTAEPRGSEDDRSDALTAAGYVMGTPLYMAPEQGEGAELDARADQYAFCVSLWWALARRFPFEGRGLELQAAKRAGPPAWPGAAGVPRHVAEAMRRGLARDPDRRFPSLPALLDEIGRDPTRRRRVGIAAAVLAIAGLGAWGMQRIDRARALAGCEVEGERAHEVGDEARLASIGDAFAATDIAYAPDTWTRAQDRIEAFTARWQATRQAVCVQAEVERTRTPELAVAARACMDAQLDGLDALLSQLAEPDATVVQRAASASASLPLVEVCTDEAHLRRRAPPSDPTEREQQAELRARLAEAQAAHATGRYDQAEAAAQAVKSGAEALGATPLVAEAQIWIGHAHEARGRYDEARVALEDALYQAMGAALDAVAAQGATALVGVVGGHLAQYDEGLRWGRLAQVLLDRSGRTADLATAELWAALGRVHHRRGEYDESIALVQRALGAEEAILGREHPRVAATLNSLGDEHFARGEYDEAIAAHERAHAILLATLGEEHPSVAASIFNIGNVHYARKDHEIAVAHYERARGIWERTLGPEHPNVAACLTTLGAVRQAEGAFDEALALHERALQIRTKAFGAESADAAGSLTHLGNARYGRGEYDAAIRLWEQALAITEKTLGPEHPNVAFALGNLGAVHHQRGEYDAAVEPYTRALAIREKALGPDHPDVAAALVNLALLQHERKAYPEAIAAFERALSVRERTAAPIDDLAAARFGLARSLATAGVDRVRARKLATAAADGYRSRGQDGAEALAMVEDWLAAQAH
jgi:tetratricopeptide (TPR) repeat protein/predicted Ser/Thr protein kinase